MTSYPFSRWLPSNDLGNIRPPTKCNCWSKLDPQIWSCPNRFNIVSGILRFFISTFWLEIAYSRPFWGFWGIYFPQMTSSIVLTPEDRPCAETRRFSYETFILWSSGDLSAGSRKKGQDSQKSHKVVIFCLFGEKPQCID